jgi:pyruvate dehydrogenase E2 component (dihydrolipoamide acetyltransferase)
MEEGTLVEWLKRDGESVKKGEALFVLESDKAAQEIEAFDEGILRIPADAPKPGDTVQVGQLIGYLVAAGESTPAGATASTLRFPAESLARPPAAPKTVRTRAESRTRAAVSSPRARRVARELGVDWKGIAGTGRGGRVRERDVRASAAQAASEPESDEIPFSATRETIATRMIASLRTTAPVTLTTRADATQVVNLRRQLGTQITAGNGIVPSVTDIFVKLAATALERHPLLNARRKSKAIVRQPHIHIGIAVDTENGLVVPVIRDVDKLSLKQVAAQSSALAEKARARRLSPADALGGTFTVTNLGMFGIDAFTPIINLPQTSILGVGAIRREAVVLDEDHIVPRDLVTLSLTFDHQVVDGAQAARFLQTLVEEIEGGQPPGDP